MAGDDFGEGKRTLGVIDGTLTQISLAVILLFPTLLAVLARPRRLAGFIAEPDDAGQRRGLLAPGPFFVVGLLCALIAASTAMPQAEGALISMGENVRSAAGAGQFWRAVSIAVPLLIAALGLGVLVWIVGRVWRLTERRLVPALRTAQYGLAGLIFVIAFAEPASTLVGPGGRDGVFEPAMILVTTAWLGYFLYDLWSAGDDPVWRRAGAALTGAAGLAVLFALVEYL